MEEVTKRVGRKVSKGVYDPATDSTRTDKKGRIRMRIEQEVTPGKDYDVWDLVADLAKRLNMVERGLMLMLSEMKSAGALPPTLLEPYGDMIDSYSSMLSTGEYQARTDLEVNNTATFLKLMQRDNTITEILREEGY